MVLQLLMDKLDPLVWFHPSIRSGPRSRDPWHVWEITSLCEFFRGGPAHAPVPLPATFAKGILETHPKSQFPVAQGKDGVGDGVRSQFFDDIPVRYPVEAKPGFHTYEVGYAHIEQLLVQLAVLPFADPVRKFSGTVKVHAQSPSKQVRTNVTQHYHTYYLGSHEARFLISLTAWLRDVSKISGGGPTIRSR
jgi:hypothetical protein